MNTILIKKNQVPLHVRVCTLPCYFFSFIVATIHYCNIRARVFRLPQCIYNAPGGVYKNLWKLWFSRSFKRVISVLVRTPVRTKTLRLVDSKLAWTNDGAVIVTCHTPWSRLLMQWCLENDFAWIITDPNSDRRANTIKKRGKGIKELRQLLHHLRAGGKIIIMVDVFNELDNCSGRFLERNYNISMLPARLAKMANVPLMAVVPELRGRKVHISDGPRFDPGTNNLDSYTMMQELLAFFDSEIKRNPSIWSEFVRGPLRKYVNDEDATRRI